MGLREEIRVVRIEPVEGAKIAKHPRGFIAPIIYVLEDGRRVESTTMRRLKRDVKSELDSLPKEITNMKASLDADGRILVIIREYSLL